MAFKIYKQNTEAIATNRGFYYQYLKTVKLWLDNYINGIDNKIYCEREDDIFEYNVESEATIFRQIKCYSDTVGLNSSEIKGSLLHFYDIYKNGTYKKSEFYIESNQTFKSRVGKSLKAWYERQKSGDFSVLDSELNETRDILKSYVQDNLDKFLKKMTEEEKAEAQTEVDNFKSKLELDGFKTFVESLRWDFSEESNTNRAIANLSEDILKIISEKIEYDNRVDSELLLGYLVNTVLEKSIEHDETKRLLTTALLQEALDKTEIDDTLFRSEIKELLKANFFIPHSLTEPFKREEIFIGREDELIEMKEFLEKENTLLLVYSIGGMGKTTLVKEFLYREKNNYAHYGYIYAGEDIKLNWVNSGFRKSLSLVMEKTDEAFTESLVAIQALEGKTLLVLDNLENIANQERTIEKIMGLAQNPNIDIVMTSREIVETIKKPYELKSLLEEDAKLLFNSIYQIENEDLLEEVLEYLDWHTFFIEKIAQTLKNKKGLLSLEDIKEKFDKQEFPDIRLKKRNSFNDLLKKLFTLDELEDDEVLLLKQLSVLPSIDIEFNFLSKIFQMDDVIEFQEDLEYLNEKGWLIYADNSYKLHQIIKEYILNNHPPKYDDIENLIDSFSSLNIFGKDGFHFIHSDFSFFVIFYKSIYSVITKIGIKNEIFYKFINRFSSLYFSLNYYEESIYLLEKLLVNEIKDDVLHWVYNSLGSSYNEIGKYQKAISFYKKALQINKDNYIYYNLMNSYLISGKYQKAINIYENILEKRLTGTENDINMYFSLGQFYKAIGKYELSILEYKKAIEITIKMNNNKSFILAKIHLIDVYREKTEYQNAISAYNDISQKVEKEFGYDNINTANSYNNIGLVYCELEKYMRALVFSRKALEIRKNLLDENHIDIAQSYHNIAIIFNGFKTKENYKKALFCSKESIRIKKMIFKENHIETSRSYLIISGTYLGLKQNKQAYNFLEKAKKIQENILSKNHPLLATTYTHLTSFFYIKKDYSKSLEYIEKAISIYDKTRNTLMINELKLLLNDINNKLKKQTFMKSQKINRNAPCPCGSGKKYKKCCGR